MQLNRFGQVNPGLPLGQPLFSAVPKPCREIPKELEMTELLQEPSQKAEKAS